MVVKYSDPKRLSAPQLSINGTGYDRTLFWPASPNVVTNFAYRMPHGALDVSVVRPSPDDHSLIPLSSVTKDSDNIRVKVRDWDAGATESSELNLRDETDPRKVGAGESGLPMVAVSCPTLSQSPTEVSALTPTLPATLPGYPNHPIPCNGTFHASAASLQSGIFTALVRVTDPEAITPSPAYLHSGIIPESNEVSSPTFALHPVTYQTIRLGLFPQLNGTTMPAAGECNDLVTIMPRFDIPYTPPPTAPPAPPALQSTVTWNFGGGATPNTVTGFVATARLTSVGHFSGTCKIRFPELPSVPEQTFPFSYEVTMSPAPLPATFLKPPEPLPGNPDCGQPLGFRHFMGCLSAPDDLGRGSAAVFCPASTVDPVFASNVLFFSELKLAGHAPTVGYVLWHPVPGSDGVYPVGGSESLDGLAPIDSRIVDIDAVATDQGVILAINLKAESDGKGRVIIAAGRYPLNGPNWASREIAGPDGTNPLDRVAGLPENGTAFNVQEGTDQMDLALISSDPMTSRAVVAFAGIPSSGNRTAMLKAAFGGVSWSVPPTVSATFSNLEEPAGGISNAAFNPSIAVLDASPNKRVGIAYYNQGDGSSPLDLDYVSKLDQDLQWAAPHVIDAENAGQDISMAVLGTGADERFAVAYAAVSPQTSGAEVRFTRANVFTPTQTSDWDSPYVIQPAGPTDNFGRDIELANLDGSPTVTYTKRRSFAASVDEPPLLDLFIAHCCTVFPTDPTTWAVVPLALGGSTSTFGYENTLVPIPAGVVTDVPGPSSLVAFYARPIFNGPSDYQAEFTFLRNGVSW